MHLADTKFIILKEKEYGMTKAEKKKISSHLNLPLKNKESKAKVRSEEQKSIWE